MAMLVSDPRLALLPSPGPDPDPGTGIQVALTQTPLPRPPDEGAFASLLDRLLDCRALAEPEARALMDQVLGGDLGPERLAAFVTALRAKGLTVDELVGFARSLRHHAHPITRAPGLLLDTCGTGGAPQKSFNVSTAAAVVAAAAGIPVAKHGNRSVTRPSGSADVLEALGARLDLTPAQASRVLAQQGLAFLYAPVHHPAMRHAAPVRKALGIRTVFNLLGPLSNPAAATHQVLGVHDPLLLRPMAEALTRLGVQGGFVLHSEPGYDEAMPTGLVRSVAIRGGEAGPTRTLDPAALGLAYAKPDDLGPLAPQESAATLRRILDGSLGGPRADAVALNAAFALVATERARTLAAGVEQARDILTAGTGRAKLDAFVAATRSA